MLMMKRFMVVVIVCMWFVICDCRMVKLMLMYVFLRIVGVVNLSIVSFELVVV